MSLKWQKLGCLTATSTHRPYLAWVARDEPWAASCFSQVCDPLWDQMCWSLPFNPPQLWASEQSLTRVCSVESGWSLPNVGGSWRNPPLLLSGTWVLLTARSFRTASRTGPRPLLLSIIHFKSRYLPPRIVLVQSRSMLPNPKGSTHIYTFRKLIGFDALTWWEGTFYSAPCHFFAA